MSNKAHEMKKKSKRKSKADGNLAVNMKDQENFEAKVDQLPTEVS